MKPDYKSGVLPLELQEHLVPVVGVGPTFPILRVSCIQPLCQTGLLVDTVVIETTSSECKSDVLPLNYRPIEILYITSLKQLWKEKTMLIT